MQEILAQKAAIMVGVHDGDFHADDVFAVAVLQLAFPGKIIVVRTRSVNLLMQCNLRVDVGGKYDPLTGDFDHHQQGAPCRENGIPYAAFGLVWNEFFLRCGASPFGHRFVEQRLVQVVDAADNGYELFECLVEAVKPYGVVEQIESFLPPWDPAEVEPNKNYFQEAVDFAKQLLQREIVQAKLMLSMQSVFAQAKYEALTWGLQYLLFEQNLPWDKDSLPEDILYVIFHAGENDWRVQAAPLEVGSFDMRKPLPQNWAGLRNEELVAVTGVADAVFCHRGRFICGAKSKEGALKLVKLALEN